MDPRGAELLPIGTDPRTLLGVWEFDRVITDHLADEVLRVAGTLELTLEKDDGIRWSERGTLRRAGSDMAVFRVLFVRPRSEEWAVTFEDGRDFHPWRTGKEVEHPCGPDTYRGLVVADDESADGLRTGEWSVRWRVTGPAKDYTMVSQMRRARTDRRIGP